jgi:hypothetical protein
MDSKTFSRRIKKISIYMGYGEAGEILRKQVVEALKNTGMPAREFLLQALKIHSSTVKK